MQDQSRQISSVTSLIDSAPASHDEAGFTLIEILVALAILGAAFAALMPVFSDSLSRVEQLRHKVAATSKAQSLLDQFEVDSVFRKGVLQGGDAGLSWRIDTSPYGSKEDRESWLYDVQQVTVTVSWPSSRPQSSIMLTTLYLSRKE